MGIMQEKKNTQNLSVEFMGILFFLKSNIEATYVIYLDRKVNFSKF